LWLLAQTSHVLVSIRSRRVEDTLACVNLMRLTHEVDGYPRYLPDDLTSFLSDSAELAAWVAESGDNVVGHVALHAGLRDPAAGVAVPASGLRPEQLAVVARLMVNPEVRRRGVAGRLLTAATDYAHRHRLRPVLDVQQVSGPALSLYESLGWTRAGPLTLPVAGHQPLELWVYVGPEGRERP
jgi:GNAT superfamily N-acetyltransferase